MDNGEYVPHLPQTRKLYELSLAVWLAFQGGLELTGCAVFRNKLPIKIADVVDSKIYILAWNKDRLQKTSRIKPLNGEWFPEDRYINFLNATGGVFIFDSVSNGVIFTCLPATAIDADYDALCMDGFPVPGTARAGSLDRTLTMFGVERGRSP